ncbi:TVP38/TMEM64 family protein [Streptomyces sp. NPDC088733]|uniref:TVP38/TMEM64 family protein n=1 Tax=Streptomyces sp. NPDC088733 TaxID=3365880 RepID=UPI00381B3FC0
MSDAPALSGSRPRSRLRVSPWVRLALLVVLLVGAGVCVLLFEPQRYLADGWPSQLTGFAAIVLFTVGYGICATAFVPRPLLSMGAGALFGSVWGLTAAIGGTVISAAICFVLGRVLGRDALRPLLRGRILQSADRQLSRHGFRTMLLMRLFPGIPFSAANYAAAVSETRLVPYLIATALGVIPNTAAYVVAGSRAATPTSPVFLLAMGFLAVTGLGALVFTAWARRQRR